MTKPILAFQVDSLHKLNFRTDSTAAIAKHAQGLGYKIFTYQPEDLKVIDSKVFAIGHFTKFFNDQPFYEVEKQHEIDLDSAQMVFIRQDPPFDINYITSCYILDLLKKATVLNPPKVLINFPEKIIPFYFSDVMPKTIITNSKQDILDFLEQWQKIVLKPLYGHGGKGIVVVDSSNRVNVSTYIDYMSVNNLPIIAQEYLPEVEYGDIRVVMSFDKIITAFKRVPEQRNFRANLAQGGTAMAYELNEQEIKLCERIGVFLKQNNIYFAGIDLLNGKIIEVNITSPTGIATANKLYNSHFEKEIFDLIMK